jgi:hypothetical protein
MNKSKFVKLLTHLSIKEQKAFESFVLCGFMTSSEALQNLCQQIFSHYPSIEQTALDKQQIYSQLYPGQSYNEKRMNNLISDLNALLEHFLMFRQFQGEELLQKRLLIKALLERDGLPFIDRAIRKYEKRAKQKPDKSFEAYYEKMAFHDLVDQYAVVQGKRAFDQNLQQKNDALDLYYWCHKFSIACDMLSRNIVTQSGYQCHFWEDLVLHFQKNSLQLKEHPVLQIYFKTYQMLSEIGKTDHYFELKTLLKRHIPLFPTHEINNIYKYLLNYCVRKINSGEELFYREIHELYKILLKEAILFQNGYLTQWTYINIITAAIRLKEYEWTEGFIYEYRNALLPEERNNVFNYGLSALYFEKRDYLKALEYLNTVEFTDSSYHLRAKILQLKSYFELEEEEAMLSLIEAFQKYIKRSKSIPDYQKKANRNFLKFTKQLHKLRIQQSTAHRLVFERKRQAVTETLANTEPIANKKWLKEKLKSIQ